MKINKAHFVDSKDPVKMTPGKMLKTLRKLQGFSQNQLAKKTGIAQANISRMEKDHQQIGRERALTLAKALKVHPAVLLFPNYEVEYKEAI
jgi:transcriptional regulator with XRE-family HTH domain